MTKLLEKAIAKLKTRPISEQDSIAGNTPSGRNRSWCCKVRLRGLKLERIL